MIVSINFASNEFRKQQWWNSKTAKLFGGINKVVEYHPDDINSDILKEIQTMFPASKGYGNYFWKPYIIKKTLQQLEQGDYLIYADSGTIFLKNVRKLINHMEKKQKEIFCFRLPLIERQWTKRDAFVLMDCDSSEYTDTPQITANFFILKKGSESVHFIDQYFNYCSDHRIISDAENTMKLPNYTEFIAHRHDQSVLSLLCKKTNVLIESDLSDYGVFPHKYIHEKRYVYDEALLDSSGNVFKGTILANRRANPFFYLVKYYIHLLFFKLKIGT